MANCSIDQWLRFAQSALTEAGIASARLDATLLLQHVTQKTHEWVISHGDTTITDTDLEQLNKLVARRKAREPLAYIIGSKEFYGYSFSVNTSVLIPRPESEEIIELLKSLMLNQNINTIIDIGTGSGCLAIASKLLWPHTHVLAVDVSDDALATARKNAKAHNVALQLRKLDLRTSLPAMPKTRPYVILANLPYVPKKLITSPEITAEPEIALFSGSDGMDHYDAFWKQISNLKNKPTHVITESLKGQHSLMRELALKSGYTLETTRTLVQRFIHTA